MVGFWNNYFFKNQIGVLYLDKQDLRNCHNTPVVRDTQNLINTFRLTRLCHAPYKKNVPVA